MSKLRPAADWPSGTVVRLEHRSRLLAQNPWGDPTKRALHVYLPDTYDESGPPFVTLWDLAAYTNAGPGHLNWKNHGENLAQRLDRLIGQGTMAPAVVVIPDCYTSLGGNQYVNSVSVGPYADYLLEELLPFVSGRFNVIDSRDGRGLFGKSSGGYGALYHAMHYPEFWGAAASHAGDIGFEWVYRAEFPAVCRALEPYAGDVLSFMRSFWQKNRPAGQDFSTMMVLAMAASYDADSANPESIRLPFDLRTCELDATRWSNWLAFDPLEMLSGREQALKSLRALYLDVGAQDQYHIQFGTRRFVDRLVEAGVPHRYEEFEGTHSGIDWRLDHSLPYLVAALKNDDLP